MSVFGVVHVVCALVIAVPARAQIAARPDTLGAAIRHRDARQLDSALALLRPYSAAHPESAQAARLLVETLYWTGDVSGAKAAGEVALAAHGDDAWLRLFYGRILAESGELARAREIVLPLRDTRDNARAEQLLGTIAYWDADLREAKRAFQSALTADPGLTDVRRQLADVREQIDPALRVSALASHDDQQIDALASNASVSLFASARTSVVARTGFTAFSLNDSANRSLARGELVGEQWLVHRRARVFAAAGGVRRSWGGANDWTATVGADFRPTPAMRLQLRRDRAPYTDTEASLSTAVMTNTGAAILDWDRGGWLAQVTARLQSYGDDNTVGTGYAWILAPVIQDESGTLRVGYSVAAQNAAELRFQARQPQTSSAASEIPGRYAPYYTPRHLMTHSALAAFSVDLGRNVVWRANGAYGFRATEDAPVLVRSFTTAGAPVAVLSAYHREFRPWSGRTTFTLAPEKRAMLAAGAEMMHSAFYTARSAFIELTYRLR